MAAVSGHPAHGGGGAGDTALPAAFQGAVDLLNTTRLRPEIRVGTAPAPRRLAPHAFALTAGVAVEEEEPADGRLVLLHEPDGHEAWGGDFRIVTLARAELEPEMAADPLLCEVGWAWLTDALESYSARFTEPSGTVTRCASQYFGALADRAATTEIEVRASWTPVDARFDRHLAAWCELLCTCAGLPPAAPGPAGSGPGSTPYLGGVVPMPARRSRPR